MDKLHKKIYEVLGNKQGIELLEELQTSLFCEIPKNFNNANEFIFIDGKRQLIRDLVIILKTIDEEINNVK